MTRRPPGAIRALMSLLALLATAGCGTSGLDVRYPEAGANSSMLAAVPPRRVEIRRVADRRMDTRRIGSAAKNGDLLTSRPVVEIVRDALVVELSKNGHAVGAAGVDGVVAADVEEFWLDVVTGYSKVQYVGKVAIALTVSDGRTGNGLFSHRYIGIKRGQVDEASEGAARDVMEAALARTMRDLATDPGLVAALATLPGAEPR
jgi:uncharacterized lipoprotein YajG